jgi:RHS repeat-associated protein
MEAALHARSLLAAGLLQPLSENSRPGHQLSTVALYPGIGFVNSNTATGLRVCLYDDGIGSRSTGKERDSESGLDYFGARYFGSALGRFTSPDPLPGWANDPQSWNMYAYGRNNPLKYTDPDGETYRVCDSNGQNCNDLSDADFENEQKSSQGNGEHFNNGSLYHYDSNGGRVNDGTYNQTDVDIDPAVASAFRTAGVQSSAQLNAFMRDAAMTAAGGLVFSGAAAAITELAPAAEGLPMLRQVAEVLSNNSLKHIAKHLEEFQALDPSMTMDKIIAIGTEVAQTGSQVAGNAFTKTVQIGGQEVTVRAVLNSNNALRSVHIFQ